MIVLIQLAAVILLIAFDQFTKTLAVTHLQGQESVVLIDKVFQLTYVENRGAAFGILQDKVIYLAIFTGIIVLAIAWFSWKMPPTRKYVPLRICLVFLMAGAVGNLVDRIRLNYVVDFFYFSLIDFPVFNVADIYVVCSAIAFAYLMLFHYKDEDILTIGKVK